MKASRVDLALVSIGILFLGLLISLFYQPAVSMAAEVKLDCDIQSGSCQKELDNRTVELEILPKPVKAMTDLVFQVKVSGDPLSAPPLIDLGMPGMKMGPNRVILKENDMVVYEGQGVIVRCHSGKTIWQATITLPNIGNAVFTFDVVY